jgi:hydrogenase maturation protease
MEIALQRSSIVSPRLEYSTIVIGLGNPILGDDGVGWRVAESVANRLKDDQNGIHREVEVDCLSVGGLSLMERLVGYKRAILVDAILTGSSPIGTVSQFDLQELPNRALGHMSSSHDTTLQTALDVGKRMGAILPESIQVIAIEAENLFVFSEQLTAAVEAAVPKAVELVFATLE